MQTCCESYILCPISELYMMLSGKRFSRWPMTKCKLLNGTETSFGCALISIITVTWVRQRILRKAGKTPSREEGCYKERKFAKFPRQPLPTQMPNPPPPKKANKQINKNDIGNQAKTREVEKKYKIFANPVFITWGRRSQWRKCLKINYVFAKQNMN